MNGRDATRTDRDFLCATVETAIKAGATTINIPDTVGIQPGIFRDYHHVAPARAGYLKRLSRPIAIDLGLAVANSLSGVQAVRGKSSAPLMAWVNASNAALEEIVMALNVRNDAMPQWTNIETTSLSRASKLVSSVTAFPYNIIKLSLDKMLAHESGIHQDGIKTTRLTKS